MKKSKINSEDITKDVNDIFNIVNKLENLEKITNKDLKTLQKEAEDQEEKIKNKYKNLDTEK